MFQNKLSKLLVPKGLSTVKPSPNFLLMDLPNKLALDFIDSKILKRK